MSTKIMTWIWENSETQGSDRMVLLALADNANDQGVCWPSLETIAKKCRLSRRYVIDVIAKLEKEGHVHVETRRNGPKNLSNVYTILVNPTSLPSEPPITTPSEEEITRVVNPTSPEPSVNQVIKEPSVKKESAGNKPATPPAPPPDPREELRLDKTREGAYLQGQFAESCKGKNRRPISHYQNPQQKLAYENAYRLLGGELFGLIRKGISRSRVSLPAMLAWLEACTKNNLSGNGNGHKPAPSRDPAKYITPQYADVINPDSDYEMSEKMKEYIKRTGDDVS